MSVFTGYSFREVATVKVLKQVEKHLLEQTQDHCGNLERFNCTICLQYFGQLL